MSEEKKTQRDKTTKGIINKNKNHSTLLAENYNQPIRYVEQAECKTILSSGALITQGVGPCIAIIAYGTAIYLDEDDKNQSEEFISLYHSEDSFYQLYCVELDDAPTLEKLAQTPVPTLIKHENNFWLYGLNANKEHQLTQLSPLNEYQNILFSNKLTLHPITEAMYKNIGKAKAHCHYFDLTGKEEIEQEDNFNYCVEITRQDLVENLFSDIDNTLADKADTEDAELVEIKIHQIVLIGGQKADPSSELSGSEMRAMALKKIFGTVEILSDEIEQDMDLAVDFSELTLVSNKLLQTQGENYFDLVAFFSQTERKFLINAVAIPPSTPPASPEKTFDTTSKGQKRLRENQEKNESPLKRSRTGSTNQNNLQNQAFHAIQPPQIMMFSKPFFPPYFPSGITTVIKENCLPAIIGNTALKSGI